MRGNTSEILPQNRNIKQERREESVREKGEEHKREEQVNNRLNE